MFDRDYILYQMPTLEGWAWIAWATENNGFSSVELAEPGYLEQEVAKKRCPK